jgi:hypothetical protein
MKEEAIRTMIAELKTKLIGNLFMDAEIHDEIYRLKLQLNPEIATRPELDDEECIACGS